MKIIRNLFLLSLSLFIVSCSDIDSEYIATYIYLNNTEKSIELILMGDIVEGQTLIDEKIKKYEIDPSNSLSFNISLPTDKEITTRPINILKANNLLGDSLRINFNNQKTVTYIRDLIGEDSIYSEENYHYNQTGDYAITFEFQLE